MKSMFSRFEFLKDYGKRRLSSIQAVPQWATGVNHVSDEVVLNFEDGMQLVVTSGFEDVETFFGIDEDAVFSIRECRNHIAKSNLDGLEMATVLVGEKPQSIEVFFDEISPEDKSETCVFPVALFIRTPLRSIGICRDMINGTWLDAEFRNATSEMVFSLEDMWEGCGEDSPITVKRQSFDYLSGTLKTVEERVFTGTNALESED